jgi:hypothetical protein
MGESFAIALNRMLHVEMDVFHAKGFAAQNVFFWPSTKTRSWGARLRALQIA